MWLLVAILAVQQPATVDRLVAGNINARGGLDQLRAIRSLRHFLSPNGHKGFRKPRYKPFPPDTDLRSRCRSGSELARRTPAEPVLVDVGSDRQLAALHDDIGPEQQHRFADAQAGVAKERGEQPACCPTQLVRSAPRSSGTETVATPTA